jgi:hypothetical protein
LREEGKCTDWYRAITGTVLLAAVLMILPPETPVDKGGDVDWFGAYLGLSGLVLFNFVWK